MFDDRRVSNRLWGVGVSILALSLAMPVAAQEESEDIIVTARKREESLFSVPIAVNAISGKQLQDSNITDVNDLQVLTPSLFANTTNAPSVNTTFRIRGVGTTGNNAGLEGAVGVFIDGVYRNRSGLGLADLVDVNRVEVLRGPQSTLFGKNTSAGAISILTNKPDDKLAGFIQGEAGNLDRRRVNAWVNLPVVDGVLATRFAGGFFQRDGFIKEVNRGLTINDRDRFYFRGQTLWTPNEDFDLRIISDYSNLDERSGSAVRLFNGPTTPIIAALSALNGTAPPVPAKRRNSLNGSPFDLDAEDWGISAEANWQVSDGVKLTNIAAWRDFHDTHATDVDYTGADLVAYLNKFSDRVFTEEFRISGHSDFTSIDSIDWLVGAYYTNEKIARFNPLQNGTQAGNYWCALFTQGLVPECFGPPGAGIPVVALPSPPFPVPSTAIFNLFVPGTGSFDSFGQTGKSYAGFGQMSVNVTEAFSVTGGVRYNVEKKNGFGTSVNNNPAAPFFPFWLGPVFNYNTDFSEDAWTGSASAQYEWTDDLMTYASYAHGYKAGGINLDRTAAGIMGVDPVPLDPRFNGETSNSYEIGFKSRWLDGKLLLNLTGFYTKFGNFQVLNFDGLTFFIDNVSGARSMGIEAEAAVTPMEGLTLAGGITYADTRYADGASLPVRDPLTGGFLPALLIGGRPLTNAPTWSMSASVTYEFPIVETVAGFVHGDIFYGSSRNTNSGLLPQYEQDGYSTVNARAGVRLGDGKYELALFCQNCGDKDYKTTVFNSIAQDGSYDTFIGNGREWGGSVSLKF